MSGLLLDEMLPASIAAKLTDAGFDVEAVVARPDFRGAADADLLEAATREGRVVVTGNIGDFVSLSNAWAGQGRIHPGIVLVSSKTFPMARQRSVQIAAALLARCTSGRWPERGQWDFLRP